MEKVKKLTKIDKVTKHGISLRKILLSTSSYYQNIGGHNASIISNSIEEFLIR